VLTLYQRQWIRLFESYSVQDLFFDIGLLNLLLVDQDVLPDYLHGVLLVRVAHQVDLAIGALAHDPDGLEVLQLELIRRPSLTVQRR